MHASSCFTNSGRWVTATDSTKSQTLSRSICASHTKESCQQPLMPDSAVTSHLRQQVTSKVNLT